MPDLFVQTAQDLVLRDYQLAAIESARDNIRRGVRRQILCSPTGSGKTIIGLGLMKAASDVASRSAFLVDRSALVDQTSAALDLYGIDHGVMQADHWRSRPRAYVQLVSAQTLARRLGKGGYVDHFLKGLRFVLIDEAHTLYQSTLDWLDVLPENCSIIGLTATPFAKGLGRHYQAIVNVATTDELIASRMLVKPIVFVAVEVDATGVPVKSTGEWDERGLEREGIKIVGDVVTEYIKRTTERFGGPVKTICFSSTVAHGEEICRAFAQVGLNFQNISYHDDEDERRAKIAEFRKAGSLITGLVSCDALAKGFDVPDVKVCLLCRPLRKSLTTHIQQIGRVMRPAAGKTEALVIDHAGNTLRFLRDTVDFWANGVDELNESAEKDKVARTIEKKERAELVCCGCQAVMPPSVRVCPACGRERPSRASGVTVVGGTTQEVDLRGASGRKFEFTSHPILKDPAVAFQSFLAFTTHRKRGDEAAGRRWAAGLFRGVYGKWPPRTFDALPHNSEMMTLEVESFCRKEMARYSKQRGANAA